MSPEGTHGSVGGSVGEVFWGLVCGVLGGVSRTQVSLTALWEFSLFFSHSHPAASDSGLYEVVFHSCICNPPLEKSRIRKFPLGPNLCHFGRAWHGVWVTQVNFFLSSINASRLTLFSPVVCWTSPLETEKTKTLIHWWLVQDTVLQELPNCSKEGLEPVHRPLLECTDKRRHFDLWIDTKLWLLRVRM